MAATGRPVTGYVGRGEQTPTPVGKVAVWALLIAFVGLFWLVIFGVV